MSISQELERKVEMGMTINYMEEELEILKRRMEQLKADCEFLEYAIIWENEHNDNTRL